MMNQVTTAETLNSEWKSLYIIGGMAALMAGVLFRRNIAAEISLFSEYKIPSSASDWFFLLQSNRLLGLAYLNTFDLVNYVLVGLMFLALFVALKRVNHSYMAIALTFGFLGIAVYFASNTAFSMLSLSEQYATAATDAQKDTLISTGEAMLALNSFTNSIAMPSTGGLMSLFLIAFAGLITSITMLRSDIFKRSIAYIGILASAFDFIYCIAFIFLTTIDSELLALIFIPAAGLFWMVWHIIVGWRLYQLGK